MLHQYLSVTESNVIRGDKNGERFVYSNRKSAEI